MRGTAEAATVPELAALPFASEFVILEKNSTSSAHNTALDAWLDAPEQNAVNTFIVVGDCTDLCTYQLAMHLKLRANAHGQGRRVVVPENCVNTYDMPVDLAARLGLPPHDGDMSHLMFLYNMWLNGVEVVAGVRV